MSDDETEIEWEEVSEVDSQESSDGDRGGEFRVTVEVSRTKEFKSHEEAEQFGRKMKSNLEKDSALDLYDIGRVGVLRSDRVR